MTAGPNADSGCLQHLAGAQLQDAILSAHADDDAARLAALYERAADLSEAQSDIDEACFFLTQALVFALVCGSQRQVKIRDRLHSFGREEL